MIDSHTRGPPPAIRATASMPSWARARGRVDSITTSAVATSAPRASMPDRSPRSTQHRRLAGVDEVEERRRPAAGAVDAAGRLDLDDVHAGLGEQLPAQRPGPQRRQVDHPQPAQVDTGAGPRPSSVGITATSSSRRSPSAPTARPSSPALSTSVASRRCRITVATPDHGAGRSSSTPIHAGSRSRSSRSRQRHGQPSIGGAQQAGRPTAADRTASGEAGDRRPLTEQGRSVHVDGPAGARRHRAQSLRRGLRHVDDS